MRSEGEKYERPNAQQGAGWAFGFLRGMFFLTHFPYVIQKSKSTFVLKHDPSESNETTFEVASFIVFQLWHFSWKSLRESKSDFRENREK